MVGSKTSLLKHTSSLAAVLFVSGVAAAHAHHATEVRLDETAIVDGVNVMCTGVGLDARYEAMMNSFPLRLEITGKNGQYLGDQIVELGGENLSGQISIYCSGPWALFDVPSGRYTVTTHAGHDGPSKTATVDVSGPDQDRFVMSFPELGGAVSPQQFAALER